MAKSKETDRLVMLTSIGVLFSEVGCFHLLFRLQPDLDPEFDNMLDLADRLTYLSWLGFIVSGAALFTLRRKTEIVPGYVRWLCLVVSTSSLCVGVTGVIWVLNLGGH